MRTRRDFLKTATVGTAGIALSGSGIGDLFALSKSSSAWRQGLKINPALDNLRVICCYDESMIVNKIASDFSRQNESVNASAIQKDMDAMAFRLTNLSSADAAWKTIFMKPSAKQWSEVKAAIKVNCGNPLNMPRAAVVGKICSALMLCGVLPANITIFDSCGGAWGKYCDTSGNPIAGIPSGVVIHSLTRDGPLVPVGSGTLQCSSVIAKENTDHTISYIADILVNCAVNKGNDTAYGGFTMCMKNHTGTLKYSCPASAQELIDENQCEAIIGTGTSDIPCRQQLCVVDSLWASSTGPSGAWSHVPCCLVMGVLAPVVDFLTAEKIRKPSNIMNTAYNTTVVYNWLSQFGYAPTDPSWIVFSPSTGAGQGIRSVASECTSVRVSLSSSSPDIEFIMPVQNVPATIEIFDLRGRRVHAITLPPDADHRVTVAWNGAESAGSRVITGRYAVKCTMGGVIKTGMAQVRHT